LAKVVSVASAEPSRQVYGHAVFEKEWFNVYCFAKPEDAEKFMQRFGGEKFDPSQRGKGQQPGALEEGLGL
jgi:hypothetical protein